MNGLNSANSDLEARAEARRFHEELESLLKRFDPGHFVLGCSEQIGQVLDGKAMPKYWRPHHLIHAIEAMCAYMRGHRTLQLDRAWLAKVMNFYHDHEDTHIHHVLVVEQDMHLAVHNMASQQFQFQYNPHYRDMARGFAVLGNGLRVTADRFESKYGLTVNDWFRVTLCCFALLSSKNPPTVTVDSMQSAVGRGDPPLDATPILKYLELVSRTMDEVGEQFRAERDELSRPYLHWMIRSGFIERPLLEFETGCYVSPVPSLLFQNATTGLLRMCRPFSPDFGREIGESFAGYVREILGQLQHQNITQPDILAGDIQRACDFAVETDDAVILIECKAVSETARFTLVNAMRQQNSTSKIHDGADQLYQTATNASPELLGFDRAGKPMYGLIVTLGCILFANSPWYRDRILDWGESHFPDSLVRDPYVMGVADLELFVLATISEGLTPRQLIEHKEAEDYMSVGDWDVYLPKLMRGRIRSEERLDAAERSMETLIRATLGDDYYNRFRPDSSSDG